MIRQFEDQDLMQVTRIWLDSHIRANGFISTEFWRSGSDMLEAAIAASDVYVSVDRKNINGFIQVDGQNIIGLFCVYTRQFRKICSQLLEYVQSLSSELTLHAYMQDEEAIKAYRHEHFELKGDSVNEYTGEIERILYWTKD